jgi:hypothetical protein
MAKVTISIEDLPNGKVRAVSTPSFEQLIKGEIAGSDLTSAQGYALKAMNAIREVSKSNEPTNKILIPKIGR